MSETSNTAVQISDVTKVFNHGKPNEVHALEHIDLSIEEGSFVSLIGPSGCGKSTLLRLMGALTHPTEGDMIIKGKSADQARLDRDYGMAFQTSGLFDWRSITQNIELPLQLMGWSRSDRKERAAEMLDLVKLSEFGDHYPRELSGGMQQRVNLARALLTDLATLQHNGDKAAVDAFLEKYGVMSAPMAKALKKVESIPVDIRPIFPLAGESGDPLSL